MGLCGFKPSLWYGFSYADDESRYAPLDIYVVMGGGEQN